MATEPQEGPTAVGHLTAVPEAAAQGADPSALRRLASMVAQAATIVQAPVQDLPVQVVLLQLLEVGVLTAAEEEEEVAPTRRV
jgi:hypothetical protein